MVVNPNLETKIMVVNPNLETKIMVVNPNLNSNMSYNDVWSIINNEAIY